MDFDTPAPFFLFYHTSLDFSTLSTRPYREQYNKWWNILARRFKSLHISKLAVAWEKGLIPLKLNEKYVIDDVSFNIMEIAIIGAYKEQISMPDFFRTMLAIYQSGHLVCGWTGDQANGKFIAY